MASLIGKEIGKYRITERLGQGGMAEVYAGIHTHLDRKVAVKVLHSYLLEGGDFVARFKREAKAVANLRHPSIVQVYDFDVQDDLIFMVMEYIDGVNLHTKLIEVGNRGERMPIKLIGSIINDIASALDYAHTKGMLHRDIKPSNIMIDSEDKAYLTDFGIAKLLSDQKFTATGTLVGTPAYMSPEQGLGDDVSKESDIYSLGVVAFEMLTGQVPYDAKTPIGIVHKQINDPIPNMSELVEGVPGTAQEVIDRALAKSPESRFSSAEDLVGALRTALVALQSTDPIAVPAEESPTLVDDGLDAPTVTMDAEELEQPTMVMEEEKPAKEKKPKKETKPKPAGDKKKIPIWAYLAGGAALLAIAAVILIPVLDINLSGLGSTSDTNKVELIFSADHPDEGLTLLDNVPDGNFGVVDVDNGQAITTGSGSSFTAVDGNSADDFYLYFDADDSKINRIAEGSEITILVEYLDEGTDAFDLQYDAHSGGDLGDGSFKGAGIINKTNTGEFRTAQFTVFDAYFGNRNHGADIRIGDIGDGAETIRSVTIIYAAADTAGEEPEEESVESGDDHSSGEELYNQANALFQEGNFSECIELCYQALDAGYETADLYNLIGRSHRNMSAFEQALGPLDMAIELDADHFWARYNRGLVRMNIDDYYGAVEDLSAATELDPDSWNAWHYLGEAAYWTFDDALFDQGLDALSRAIEIDPDRYQSYYYRGRIKMSGGDRDLEGALTDLSTALELNPEDSELWNTRGVVYWETEQWELCIPDYSDAINLNPENPYLYKERGDCYLGAGDLDAARVDYERTVQIAEGNSDWEEVLIQAQTWLDQNP